LSGFRKGIDPIKIEATIEMLNWVYEMEENQKSGYAGMGQFLQYLGYDYEMENGVGKVGKYGTARMAGGAFDFNTDRYEECDIKYLTIASELSKQDPSMLNPLQILAINDPTGLYMKSAESIKIGFDDAQYNIYNDFIWPMPSQATELMTSLNKLETETYANIITGKAPVSAWDTFASDWMKQGGDKVTQWVNEEDAKHV
jgi:putative aldouronate transport system substrate-binding protein